MPIQITGLDATLRAMRGGTQVVGVKIAEGLKNAAGVLYRRSQKLVPVDTGALKASGMIETTGVGFGAVSKVSYGGTSAPYAFIVHERLDLYHAPPTQARYLADAINSVRGVMRQVVRRPLLAGVIPHGTMRGDEE